MARLNLLPAFEKLDACRVGIVLGARCVGGGFAGLGFVNDVEDRKSDVYADSRVVVLESVDSTCRSC